MSRFINLFFGLLLIPPSLFAMDTALFDGICEWVKAREQLVLEHGRRLTADEQHLARWVGVAYPEKIRILAVEKIETPNDPVLMNLSAAGSLQSPNNAAQTLQYGIFMRHKSLHERALLVHELTHVAQYERLGGIPEFLACYLREVDVHGYDESPLEQEAIAMEEKFNRLNLSLPATE